MKEQVRSSRVVRYSDRDSEEKERDREIDRYRDRDRERERIEVAKVHRLVIYKVSGGTPIH